MITMRVAVVATLVVAIVTGRQLAAEEAVASGPKTLAVQNRQHAMTHEFSAWVGTLPLDAFEKGLTFSGAYTLHFTDLIAWEIGQFTYSHGIETALKDELENVSVEPTQFEVVRYYATSSILFKPVYGKMSLLNRALIYGEVFFLIGGGYGQLTIERRAVVNAGAGGRIYAGKYVSFRVELRDIMFVLSDDIQNELWIAGGVCLGFG
ncbi:MAG: outer membrane beta-barrel domain-containing protein [Myxococcota bacterium]|nr:outer membrane beta-barrel domain-containing protein [Myxococcota bacterium]